VYHDWLAASHDEGRAGRRLRRATASAGAWSNDRLAAWSPGHRLRDVAHSATNPRLTTAAAPQSSISIALSR
jgi:hypothetical protein